MVQYSQSQRSDVAVTSGSKYPEPRKVRVHENLTIVDPQIRRYRAKWERLFMEMLITSTKSGINIKNPARAAFILRIKGIKK
jgi:hypothetical protein